MKARIFILGSFLAIGNFAMATSLTDAQIADVLKTANDSEIAAARLATTQASNPQVKDFAHEMLKDHKENNKEARHVERSIKVKPEANDDSKALRDDMNSKLADLQKARTSEFDKTYMDDQVVAHQKLLNDLDQNYIPTAQNESLRQFLMGTRAHVQAHLTEAQQIQSTLQ